MLSQMQAAKARATAKAKPKLAAKSDAIPMLANVIVAKGFDHTLTLSCDVDGGKAFMSNGRRVGQLATGEERRFIGVDQLPDNLHRHVEACRSFVKLRGSRTFSWKYLV